MAGHLDDIKLNLNEGHTFSTYVGIVKDFDEWGKISAYKAKVLMPLQQADLEYMFWTGRSANVAGSNRQG